MAVSQLAPKYIRDLKTSNIEVLVTGTLVIHPPANAVDGQVVKWRLKQDNSGNRSISLDASFRVPSSSSALAFSTSANTTDILAAIYNSTDSVWDVVSFVPGYTG